MVYIVLSVRFVGQRAEELESQLKEKDSELLKRDRIITDLRVRLPASADRDAIFEKVASQSARSPRDEDYESSQAVRVATSTVSSLQVVTACCLDIFCVLNLLSDIVVLFVDECHCCIFLSYVKMTC